jgi:hypothetical protein
MTESLFSSIWSLLKVFYPLIIIVAIPVVLRYTLIYIQYKNSTYKEASGNSYFKTAFNIGNYGEFLTFRVLEKLPGNKKLLTNIYLPKENGTTTEIDLAMINEAGLFVFESKNYSGWIYGDEKSKMWTQALKNRQKHKFYNPIWQNHGHITAMKNSLKDVEENLFYSYIIFSERCELKNIKVTSTDIRLIKRNKLFSTLQKDINTLGNRLTTENIETIYSLLNVYTHVDESKKQQHIANIKM